MSEHVAGAYDEVAELYTSLFCRDLVDDVDARRWVARFVERVDSSAGPVADLGCGPGHGVDFLIRSGIDAVGVDMSEGLLEQARAAFPELDVRTGDLTRPPFDAGSLGGIFARYSIIHLAPTMLSDVIHEWAQVLAPGAPVLVSFFASLRAADHGIPFDHKVATAFELDPGTLGLLFEQHGFVDIECASDPPPEGGRPFGKGVVLATRGR